MLSLSFGRKDGSHMRTYASAGGRYPIEVYVAIFESEDIEQGIYHYNVSNNSLEQIKKGGELNKLKEFYSNQDYFEDTCYPCLIMFSMVFRRSMEKYGERGYRFALIDAGHMGQNLYLTAEYLDLGIVALGAGAGSDDQLDDIVGLVSVNENIFYSFAVGRPE